MSQRDVIQHHLPAAALEDDIDLGYSGLDRGGDGDGQRDTAG